MPAAVVTLRPSPLAGASPAALIDAWLRELDAAGRSPKTLVGHRWHLTDAFTQLADRAGVPLEVLDLAAVTHADLVEVLASYRHAPDRRFTTNPRAAGRERSDYTIARRTASLRTFFAWAARHGHIPADPAAALPTPKIRTHLPRAFDVDDARLVFKAAKLSRFPELSD
jgi:integrase/recombinase XerC